MARLTATALAAGAVSLAAAAHTDAASLARLDVREHRQQATLLHYAGTLAFFERRPRLARTPNGRMARRRARIWTRVVRRELGETRLERRQHLRARRSLQSTYAAPTSTAEVICQVFGPECSKAVAVATCESSLSTTAQNGQYLGLFQMGDYARARYGHGWDAWTQARAAYAYFRDAGWAPWECA